MTALQQNIAKLEHHLARFAKTGIRNRIGGEDRPGSGGTFQTISPVDKTVICDVARGNEDDFGAEGEVGVVLAENAAQVLRD